MIQRRLLGLFLILGTSVVALSATAGDAGACDTVAACRQQIVRIEAKIRDLQTAAGERDTLAGIVFRRDTSIPALGEAWRDPEGLIWGDIVLNSAGGVYHASLSEALRHCKGAGARLPKVEEYRRLKQAFHAPGCGTEYAPQVLPHLFSKRRPPAGFEDTDSLSWTSSYSSGVNEPMRYIFNGRTGGFDERFPALEDLPFRCVAQAKPQ